MQVRISLLCWFEAEAARARHNSQLLVLLRARSPCQGHTDIPAGVPVRARRSCHWQTQVQAGDARRWPLKLPCQRGFHGPTIRPDQAGPCQWPEVRDGRSDRRELAAGAPGYAWTRTPGYEDSGATVAPGLHAKPEGSGKVGGSSLRRHLSCLCRGSVRGSQSQPTRRAPPGHPWALQTAAAASRL
jgi:hypothetical protein